MQDQKFLNRQCGKYFNGIAFTSEKQYHCSVNEIACKKYEKFSMKILLPEGFVVIFTMQGLWKRYKSTDKPAPRWHLLLAC